MKLRCVTSYLILALALFAVPAAAEENSKVHGLISTEEAAKVIKAPEARVIDARDSLSAYMQGHLPGAIFLNPETLRVSRGGVPAQLLPPERLAEIFGAIGIGNNSPVLVYASVKDQLISSAYIATVLESLGHKNVRVIDGGFEKWQKEGREITKDIPKVEETTYKPVQADRVTAEDVQNAGDAGGTVILDARTKAHYDAGHIPGAKNLPIEDLMTTGPNGLVWKSPAELKAAAAKAGISTNTRVITYCTSGRQASHLGYTLKNILEMPNVNVYHGSMIDWTAKDLPKEQ